jgi:large subunit ribosomal protein L35Ae
MESASDTSSVACREGLRTPDVQREDRDKDPEVKHNAGLGKTQYPTQCLIKVLGVDPSDAKRIIGAKVGWPVDDPKIYGKIIGVHGRTGTLRVRFNRGVPGQALGSRVRIFE